MVRSMTTPLLLMSSATATFAVISHAFHLKKQFYPSVVYLSNSSVSMMVGCSPDSSICPQDHDAFDPSLSLSLSHTAPPSHLAFRVSHTSESQHGLCGTLPRASAPASAKVAMPGVAGKAGHSRAFLFRGFSSTSPSKPVGRSLLMADAGAL